jgi:predicted ATP-dependent endonuclease of OLD family
MNKSPHSQWDNCLVSLVLKIDRNRSAQPSCCQEQSLDSVLASKTSPTRSLSAGGKPVILLLDELGLTLHGKAQDDLLCYFDEKLAPHHQVIYSTHFPFMVSPDKFTSARIVEDVVDTKNRRRISIGTKASEDILSMYPDTLFPLQGALSYEIAQTLFIGKHTLLVEGVST